jgi:hypothetical protein
MARPERLERPTYWFEAMNPREISILALAGCGKTTISSEICNPHYAESVGEAL